MLCAIKCADKGADVTVLERNERLGKKLLATGNGKCNLSNLGATLDAYNDVFTKAILQRFTPEKIKELYPAAEALNSAMKKAIVRILQEAEQ